METQQFEPMSAGQIIDRAFRIYKNHFLRFIAIVAVVQVPFALIMVVIMAGIVGAIQTGDFLGDLTDNVQVALAIGGAIAAVIGIFFFVLISYLSNAALMKSISESYLGQDVTVGEAYRFVLPKLGSILLAAILVGIVVTVGLLLLVVPGVIFGIWFAFVTPIIVLEGTSATDSMSRSRHLARGNLGKIFLVGLIVWLISMVVGMGFGLCSSIVSAMFTHFGPENALLSIVVQQLFDLGANLLVAPLGACATILLYYDLRIRKEGFDLEMLAQSLGSGDT